MKLGIAKKLFILFFLFILIFYGTVFDLFFKVREMSARSARIVGVNNRIAALSKKMQDNLVDMDVNGKKLRLLKKDLYFTGFERARKGYIEAIADILSLNPEPPWPDLNTAYGQYIRPGPKKEMLAAGDGWEGAGRVPQWTADIETARKENQTRIDQALIRINTLSRLIVRNGMVGFGISIMVGLLGVLFITRSMLAPLNRLKTGLSQVSNDNYNHLIPVRSRDEFGELTQAFNDMSRQLKADEEIRSDFIATLSHEIRTPLSSVRESVNLVSEEVLGPVNEQQQKFLSIAGKETARITNLLNRLLDTASLDTGPGEILPLEPNHLIRETVQRLAGRAELARVNVSFTPMEEAPKVMGDPEEILQVLINLLDNAIKFSAENSRITLFLTLEAQHLMFNISDAGPGIPREKQRLVFKKYYRTQEVRDHADGVGLGLNIARRIVQAHGGTIFVKNNRDRGCTFSFSLPCVKNA
ncbi:HAMP domain-containing sensor histidine kinase [Desulfospira joergensenii]|uniref:HAMP domain-containing sensor histidine kinase n=1 Tax=Desulfospira joergensenii TaxID=53329 RepID=UPI0003B7680F|nr:HAMP domain-containing sensor histidine kinase [Desulfospira joergensenii]